MKDILAQDTRTHIVTPQQYLKYVKAGIMPPMQNHNLLREMAEKFTTPRDQTRFVMMEFRISNGRADWTHWCHKNRK